MKIKVFLDEHEHLSDAEDSLEKSLSAKKECSDGERYHDAPLNEFYDILCERHANMLNDLVKELELEIKANAGRQRYSK